MLKEYALTFIDVPAKIEVKYNNVTLFERELKVIEGWSFTILCSVTSNPTSRYSWFGPVDGDGEVLFIQNMRTNMNRSITCRADNTMVDSVGKSVIGETHVTFSLDVLCK